VKRNSTGIALFNENKESDRKLVYVYDQKDTELSWYGGHDVRPWKIRNEDDYSKIADAIVGAVNIELSTASGIEEVLYYAVAMTASEQDDIRELVGSTALKGSLLSNQDKEDQINRLCGLVTATAAYLMIRRCGLDPRSLISEEEFKDISLLNNKKALVNFGNIYTDYAQNILKFVEKETQKLAHEHPKEDISEVAQDNEVSQQIYVQDDVKSNAKAEAFEEHNDNIETTMPDQPIGVEHIEGLEQKQLTLFDPPPSVEEQNSRMFTDENDVGALSQTLISNELIDQTLLSAGGGYEAEKRRLEIAAYWQSGHSMNDFSEYLKLKIRERGQGFLVEGKQLNVWYDGDGLNLTYFPSAIENPMKHLSWIEIASKTDRLIRKGIYLSAEECDQVREHVIKGVGDRIYFIFRDTINDLHQDVFADLESTNSAPDCITYFQNLIHSNEGINQVINVLNQDIEKIQSGAIVTKFRMSYTPNSVVNELEDLRKKLKKIPVSDMFKDITYESFLTKDEIDFALKRGSNFSGGKKRIFDYFMQQKFDLNEAVNFLKNEYGTGGSYGISASVDSIDYSPSKGIEIGKRLPNKTRMTLNITYRQAASRLKYLIEHHLFLYTEEEKSVLKSSEMPKEIEDHIS
ncbi:MAG: hypothetical protein RR614_07025, partial [Eubacterium sp.]